MEYRRNYPSFFMLITLMFLFSACGHRESPSGGPKDLTKPKVVSIEPPEYGELDKEIKIVFSKPIDRNSADDGIYFYPLILKKKYRWDENTLILKIVEQLEENHNYYMTLNKDIRGIHNNRLDKNYTFVFKNGNLQENKISGKITYEQEIDRSKEVTLSLFAADTTKIFQKKIKQNTYSLDNLNSQTHIITAFIDINKNTKYNYAQEPYFRKLVKPAPLQNIDINLVYQDSIKPDLKSVEVNSNTQIELNFSEPIVSFENIVISDSLNNKPDIKAYYQEEKQLSVLLSEMDTLKYLLKIYNFKDKKGNTTALDSLFFTGTAIKDTLPPKLLKNYPQNGATVNTYKPEIVLRFSEILLKENVEVKLVNTEINSNISLDFINFNSKEYILMPKNKLKNYTGYELSLTCQDENNNISEDYSFKFIPIVR